MSEVSVHVAETPLCAEAESVVSDMSVAVRVNAWLARVHVSVVSDVSEAIRFHKTVRVAESVVSEVSAAVRVKL